MNAYIMGIIINTIIENRIVIGVVSVQDFGIDSIIKVIIPPIVKIKNIPAPYLLSVVLHHTKRTNIIIVRIIVIFFFSLVLIFCY